MAISIRGAWCTSIDIRDFIGSNAAPYKGDESFLAGPSRRTQGVWDKLPPYFKQEQKKGVLAVDAHTPSTLLAHEAGHIDRDNEVIVGLQTDERSNAPASNGSGFHDVAAEVNARVTPWGHKASLAGHLSSAT